MSSSNHGKSKKSSNEQQSRAGQIGATAAHTEQTRIEQLFSNEDFPTPAEAVTQRTTTSTSNQVCNILLDFFRLIIQLYNSIRSTERLYFLHSKQYH